MAEKSPKPSGFLETVGVAPASGRRPGASLGDAGGRPRLTVGRSARAAAAGQERPHSGEADFTESPSTSDGRHCATNRLVPSPGGSAVAGWLRGRRRVLRYFGSSLITSPI